MGGKAKKNDNRVLMGSENETVVSGQVVVTKNPCSHPGDIRLLKAIGEDDPRFNDGDYGYQLKQYFRNLVNVVVFPTTGKRPEQNKMSGGDLDGDVYFAIWD